MRQPLKIALAVVVVIAVASGCGSDDDESQGGESGKTKSAAQAAKPKAQSARARMVKCIEDAGFEITHGDQDAATATNYTVKGDNPGRRTAAVVIHSNRDDAARAAAKAGEDKGLNAVPFGRAELILYTAENTEAGVLANCVQKGYVK